jgi:hypothetical protein
MEALVRKLVDNIKKTGEESIKDPEILVAVSVPHKTWKGLIAKIAYIAVQIIDNFCKVIGKNKNK